MRLVKKSDHRYAAYKNFTLNIKTEKLKVKGFKKIYYENKNQKKIGVTILILEKADHRTRDTTSDWGKFHKDKRVNLSRGYNPQSVCNQKQSFKICEANSGITERRNKESKFTLITGDLNISIWTMDRATGHEITKDIEQLRNIID